MRTLKVSLDAKAINKLAQDLKKYEQFISKKAETLRNKVAQELAKEVAAGFNGAEGEYILFEGYQVPSVNVTVETEGDITLVIAHGQEAVFIEFGAGVYYNAGGTPHNRPPGIVNIGEYGKGYGKRQVWGYYDESGELKLTHGTPASMPMYLAVQSIVPKVVKIAKEVFGGDVL